MAIPLRETVTSLLTGPVRDDADLVNRLVPLVYDELRSIAHRLLLGERANATLGTTGLVHEAYLKLVDDARVARQGRAYFFAAAARAMRQVLVDYARRRARGKRGGGWTAVSLDSNLIAVDALADRVLGLDEALTRLAVQHPRAARVVECRYFTGMSVEETAAALEMSPRNVKRDWAFARAWLYRDLAER
jgi:RNA polymerase sigma factor (TIGR02999 family)